MISKVKPPEITQLYCVYYGGTAIAKIRSCYSFQVIVPAGDDQSALPVPFNVHDNGDEMQNKVCPYYAKNDKYCDVGCGYISPFDAKQIIMYCSSRYEECLKYRELKERIPEFALQFAN